MSGEVFEFSSEYHRIGGYDVTIFEKGHVEFETMCSCGHYVQIDMSLEDLAGVTRRAEIFCQGRQAQTIENKGGG